MKRFLFLFIVLPLTAVAAVAVFAFYPVHDRNNQIPPEALHALESDSNLVLYSLDPRRSVVGAGGDFQPLPNDVPKFQNYRILGQTTLTSPSSRRVVFDTLRQAARDWDGTIKGCFDPRHGVRATDASGTYDFLICFRCRQIYIAAPDGTHREVGIRATSDHLDSVLTAAHVPLSTH